MKEAVSDIGWKLTEPLFTIITVYIFCESHASEILYRSEKKVVTTRESSNYTLLSHSYMTVKVALFVLKRRYWASRVKRPSSRQTRVVEGVVKVTGSDLSLSAEGVMWGHQSPSLAVDELNTSTRLYLIHLSRTYHLYAPVSY